MKSPSPTTLVFLSAIAGITASPAMEDPAGAALFNVRTYGATGDGTHLDSPAIDKAITAAADAGGGTVPVPAGTYPSGSILHGGHFAILTTGCDNLTIDSVTIDTNRDGMDLDCCRNAIVSNCRVNSPHDGGVMENLTFNNLSMTDVRDQAIHITTGKRNRAPTPTQPSRGRNILISNVIADGVDQMSGIRISGLPEQPLEGVRLQNIRLTSKGGGTAKDAAIKPRELGSGYPEPGKIGTMPAYGIFARHVRGLELADIHVDFLDKDERPAAAFQDISGLDIDHFTPQTSEGVQPAVFGPDVKDITIRNSPALRKP